MNKIWNLTSRNMKRYFRDKGALFFSFLSVFIVVVLYILFLADIQIENIQTQFGNSNDIKQLVYSWIIGGLLCIPAISVPLFILTFKIDDIIAGTQDDLFLTPVKRSYIMFGYVFPACITGILMTVLTFVFGEIFIVANGGKCLSIIDCLRIFGIIVVYVFSYTGFLFFIVMQLKTTTAIAILNTILNTLIGFLAGLYFPLGYLSEEIASLIKIFPFSHSAAMFRDIMTKNTFQKVLTNTPVDAINEMKLEYGIDLTIKGHLISGYEMIIYVLVFGLLFYIGSVIIIKRYKR